MPTVGIKKTLLDKHLGKVYSEKEFDELCFEYGLELDEVTSEKAAVEKERGEAAAGDELCDSEVYKVDIPANRYDLLCVEGLTRALRVFKNEMKSPNYKLKRPTGPLQQIIVTDKTAAVRPFVVGAVLRNVTFDPDSYASFIDLQVLSCREIMVRVSEINTKIGFQLDAQTMADLLIKMSLKAKVVSENTLKVTIPPTRHDILHECDVAEDVGVADDISTRLRDDKALENAVHISNPKTQEFQVFCIQK
ncbi:phenylalanine--tRNA ligase, B5 domain protein [Teladorsagia circumcincta]|uniref:Phenylalanine--tRNA ligase, B5 domain protein n=1 Tax=Teladorsagia circumcincta TaxID=45464 RepID=A0A2G9UE73_TELCI|nr:phenylalanine--tRNA ligase, B5 domain protein [Teladorsagia circumcincta]